MGSKWVRWMIKLNHKYQIDVFECGFITSLIFTVKLINKLVWHLFFNLINESACHSQRGFYCLFCLITPESQLFSLVNSLRMSQKWESQIMSNDLWLVGLFLFLFHFYCKIIQYLCLTQGSWFIKEKKNSPNPIGNSAQSPRKNLI